jgi:hypothetical protein
MLSYAIEKFDEEERKEWMKSTPLKSDVDIHLS